MSPSAADLRARDARLEGLKRLVSRLGHALNNSLAPLTGYVTLLGEEIMQGTPGSQYLARFDGAMRRTEEVVRCLLEATHPERQFVPVTSDLDLIVRSVVARWMKGLGSWPKIDVTLKLATRCRLPLDETQWSKVVDHLLRNAESAMPKGGVLKVLLERRTLSEAEARKLGIKGIHTFYLIFEDSGCGMTDEVRQRAFDPLYTTRHEVATAGLGLTMVHSVVKLHGGQVALDSNPDGGVRVRIWLPDERLAGL